MAARGCSIGLKKKKKEKRKIPITSVKHYGWLHWSFRAIVLCGVRVIAQPKLNEKERELWRLYKPDGLRPPAKFMTFFVSNFISYITRLYSLCYHPQRCNINSPGKQKKKKQNKTKTYFTGLICMEFACMKLLSCLPETPEPFTKVMA